MPPRPPPTSIDRLAELAGLIRWSPQPLRAIPEVWTSLAGLDRQAAADRLAELTVLELKADPETLDLLQRARAQR